MSNEELLKAYEVAVTIYVSQPKDNKGNSEDNLNKLREEILRRMNNNQQIRNCSNELI